MSDTTKTFLKQLRDACEKQDRATAAQALRSIKSDGNELALGLAKAVYHGEFR